MVLFFCERMNGKLRMRDFVFSLEGLVDLNRLIFYCTPTLHVYRSVDRYSVTAAGVQRTANVLQNII